MTLMSHGHFNSTSKKVPLIKTDYRLIKTKIPAPGTDKILKDLEKYESNSMHGQLPVIWDKAEGFQVFDAAGNKWIDFTSTIFVANAGHGNPRIVKAIKRIIDKPLLHTYTFPSLERRDYIKYLIENTPPQFEKAFLVSAGTEATEAALKLMRLTGVKRGKRRPGIIAFEGNWHGRTLGAQMMSWNPKQKEWIGYLDPNIFHLPFPYPWRPEAIKNPAKYFEENLKKLCQEKGLNPKKDITGIMLETFQGWGAIFYPKTFVKAVEKFAKENEVVLAFDEMQSGFGRTGKLFGYMHYDVEPDLLACGKGAGSGVPLAVVLGRKEIMDATEIGSMSSTHSANPLVCAVGQANLETLIKDNLTENSKKLGEIFHKKLDEIKTRHQKIVSDVCGQGLLAALIFTKGQERRPLNKLCDAIAEKAMQKGLLVVHTGRESIKLAPPLIINKAALMEGLETLEQAIDETLNEQPDLIKVS